MKSHSYRSPGKLLLTLFYTTMITFWYQQRFGIALDTQREGGHKVPPHLTIHKGELGAAQPAAPHVPRERAIDAQRRRLLLA